MLDPTPRQLLWFWSIIFLFSFIFLLMPFKKNLAFHSCRAERQYQKYYLLMKDQRELLMSAALDEFLRHAIVNQVLEISSFWHIAFFHDSCFFWWFRKIWIYFPSNFGRSIIRCGEYGSHKSSSYNQSGLTIYREWLFNEPGRNIRSIPNLPRWGSSSSAWT